MAILPPDRLRHLLKYAPVLALLLLGGGASAAFLVRRRATPKSTTGAPAAGSPTASSPKPVRDAGPDAASPDAADAPDAGEACRALEAKYPSKEVTAGPKGECTLTSRTSPDCHSDSRGAWRLFAEKIEVDPSQFTEGNVRCDIAAIASTVVLLRQMGEGEARKEFQFTENAVEGGDVEIVAAFDYDGDGLDEVVLKERSWEMEGCGNTVFEILSARDGVISSYKDVPDDITSVEDVDHDGRPDLFLTPYRETQVNCISGEDCKMDGLSILAHSVANGTFSTKDAVAIEYMKRECPKPTVIADQRDIACARMWGMSAEKVLSKAHCKEFDDGDPCSPDPAAHERKPGACPGIYGSWANQEPPIILR